MSPRKRVALALASALMAAGVSLAATPTIAQAADTSWGLVAPPTTDDGPVTSSDGTDDNTSEAAPATQRPAKKKGHHRPAQY